MPTETTFLKRFRTVQNVYDYNSKNVHSDSFVPTSGLLF